jgi:hypothetical protein
VDGIGPQTPRALLLRIYQDGTPEERRAAGRALDAQSGRRSVGVAWPRRRPLEPVGATPERRAAREPFDPRAAAAGPDR